eukprot:15454777-Alexandrium_andersonii.AAC.1
MRGEGSQSKASGSPSLPLSVKAYSKGPPVKLSPAVRPPALRNQEDNRTEAEQWAAYNQGANYEPDVA